MNDDTSCGPHAHAHEVPAYLLHPDAFLIRQDIQSGPKRALYEAVGKTQSGRRFPVEMAMTRIVAEGAGRYVDADGTVAGPADPTGVRDYMDITSVDCN